MGSGATGAQESRPPLNVLALDGEDIGRPLAGAFVDAFRGALAEASGGNVSIFLEGADRARFRQPDYMASYEDWLARKYAGKRLDLVVSAANMPIEDLLRWRERLWRGVPVVIVGLDPASAKKLPPAPGLAAVLWEPDVRGTVELARTLFPRTRKMLFIGGAAYGDRLGEWMRRQLAASGRVEVIDAKAEDARALVERVGSLGDDTVVFFSAVYADALGEGYQPRAVLAALAKRTSRPIFGVTPTYLGHGLAAGVVFDIAAHAREAAALGLRMRDHPESVAIPRSVAHANVPSIDHRQIARWHPGLDALPPDAQILFAAPALWDEYRGVLLATGAALGILSVTILVLLAERSRRRRAEQGLKRLSSKLLASQEIERRRIAHELHDDVNQRVALIAIGLDGLARATDRPEPLRRLAEEARQLATDVHALALDLRPPLIGSAGLPSALRALAARVEERTGIDITVVERDWPAGIPEAIEIVLYRVAQEGLQNVVKHSNATLATLVLSGSGDHLELSVADDGAGLDEARADDPASLGLVGMRERLALVAGSLRIESGTEGGARLVARVPVPAREAPPVREGVDA